MAHIVQAEAFLKTRNDPEMSEHARNALNALLFNTGTASRHFMLVLATNLPGDLDKAVADRIDEHIKFDLPDEADRLRLLNMYFKMMIVDTKVSLRSSLCRRLADSPTPTETHF